MKRSARARLAMSGRAASSSVSSMTPSAVRSRGGSLTWPSLRASDDRGDPRAFEHARQAEADVQVEVGLTGAIAAHRAVERAAVSGVDGDRDEARAARVDAAIGDRDPGLSHLAVRLGGGRVRLGRRPGTLLGGDGGAAGNDAVGPLGHELTILVATVPRAPQRAARTAPSEELAHRSTVGVRDPQAQLRRSVEPDPGRDAGLSSRSRGRYDLDTDRPSPASSPD